MKINFMRIISFIFFISCFNVRSQVSIINALTSVYNITPRGLLEVSVMNTQNDINVILEGRILNSQNEPILNVISTPFILRKGMNVTSQLNLGIASVVYSNSQTADYVKTSHTLPSGKFTYCAIIKSLPNDVVTDEYCDNLESDISSFLFLVFPPDKDIIETKYPVLIWTHSEPFSISNNSSDYYRIIVTDLNIDESPEAAINTNIPVYMKNYLNSHSVLYPIDAKELQPGKSYAWQVQKLSNGNIVNKTEAWQFKLKAPEPVKENKYATVKKELDGTYYHVYGNKIFFRFDEGYGGSGVKYRILNEKRQIMSNNGMKGVSIDVASIGYNQFVIDLKPYQLKSGLYFLEIINEKNEMYVLKFMSE